MQESCNGLGSRGCIREAFPGKGRARKKVFSSHRLYGSEDHKIYSQGLAIDFLKKGSVDWRGEVRVDPEVGNREPGGEDNDNTACLKSPLRLRFSKLLHGHHNAFPRPRYLRSHLTAPRILMPRGPNGPASSRFLYVKPSPSPRITRRTGQFAFWPLGMARYDYTRNFFPAYS